MPHPYAAAMRQLRAGSARKLLASQFAGPACLGYGLVALASVRLQGHTRTVGDRATALTIAALLLIIGVVGTIRSLRLRVVLAEDHLAIVGITRRWTILFTNVAYVGFGRTVLGRVLYVISSDGHARFAWGISDQRGQESAEASAALDEIREAISRRRALPGTDPLPDLAVLPVVAAPTLPEGTHFVRVQVAEPSLGTVLNVIAVYIVGMIVAVGFQTAQPWTFPWILVAYAALGLLAGPLLYAVLALHLRRMARTEIAVGGGWITIRAGRGWWKSFELGSLVGVGATRQALMTNLFGRAKIRTTLRLIDAEGHRLDVDQSLLAPEVLAEIREFAADAATTELAASMLGLA